MNIKSSTVILFLLSLVIIIAVRNYVFKNNETAFSKNPILNKIPIILAVILIIVAILLLLR